MLNKENALKLVSLSLTVGIAYYGYKYLGNITKSIERNSLHISYWTVALSVILFALFYALLAIHWSRICKSLEDNQRSQYISFFASQPYKYLPTSLFTFSFRAKYAKDLGMNVKKSSISQLIENFNMLSMGLVAGALSYLVFIGEWIIVVLVLLIMAFVILRLPGSFNVSLKSKKLNINKKEQIINFTITFAAWIIAGMSLLMLSSGVGYSDISLFEAISIGSLSYTLGILAFFAPGGIGIREWVFAIFGIANVVVLAWRIQTFILDITLGALGIIVVGFKRRH